MFSSAKQAIFKIQSAVAKEAALEPPITPHVELEQSLTIHATNEVLLAAGTIGTPQLLQLSGIGDSDVLSGLGIESAVNLPDVGKNLQDHPMAVVYLQVNSTKGWDDVTRNNTVFNDYLQEWEASREGLFVNSPANTLAFMRLPSDASVFEQYSDPSPDECSAHTELIFVVCTYDLLCIRPYDKPRIDPAFLTHDFDTYAMVQALNDINELIASPEWSGYVTGSIGEITGTDTSTDATKLEFARENSYNVNHAVGTAYMSPANSTVGVVNPDLTVKGTKKLRVVDASIFPVIPPNHPQAQVYMVAERAADLIKDAYDLN
ncbi:hypothetical protein EIP86_011536 [Pleurotus ostreatoroseus]|nr:hypothetical protein EIP86_011536 [Pleurotus ostreatoroseus]